ncbi:proteasome activator complex subunit 4B-like [Anthonomus grandis grandis]|uniref:proteasome activator complex subunit 4B-like n=1 Tax=Anthonomus grandis grandis TaxID=2921223 RepID=UPI0021664BEB|nr:proteasome activator complex subunit 4B-like [Anthonomus grandis grandis]
MDEDYREKRAAVLGFRPQKENVYNGVLPYSKYLDEESKELFVAIKTNLIKSVLAREIRPGCALWTSRLNKYIKIYGLKFSKEDHIALIKLFYELITIPDLEPTRISKCAFTLSQLLKKRYLITRDELQLDWRPLYDLCVRTMLKSHSDIGMYRYISTFETSLYNAIRSCKVYFPASATQEILDELRPSLCPFNTGEISCAMHYLELLMPNAVKPEEASISYDLWFNEFMNLWEICHNTGAWENNMMWMFAGLARYQIGRIDWTPYVPQMFARFQRALQLPVNFKQRALGKQHKIDSAAIAVWIVACLHGDNNPTFFYFEKLMQTLESYFHPANVGRWTFKLRELLKKLAYLFVQRVHCERYKTPSWDSQVPDSHKLTDADIDRFVNIMKPCIEPAMYSRLGASDVTMALSYMASLRPNLVIPGILDQLYFSMDSLTEPHKMTSNMMGILSCGRYMVQGKEYNYLEGPTHVIPLLMALLPGIDPNDVRKSYVTFNFIMHFVNMIPLIDSSKAHNFYDDLTEEEHMICEATAEFEDFVLQFFDRLIQWVDSSSLDFVRLEQMTSNNNNNKSRSETFADTAIGSVVVVVLSQCSPTIFHSALRKFYNFASQTILEVQVAGKMVATVAHAFSTVDPNNTLKMFLPYLIDSLEEALNENPHMVEEEHVDAKFLFNLQILSEILDGKDEILPYMDKITNILDKTLHMTCLEASALAARALEVILNTLTLIVPREYRSHTEDFGAPVDKFLSVRVWGKPIKISELNINWYVPKEREISAVQHLVHKYLIPELEILEKYIDDKVKLTRQQLKCRIKIILSICTCHLLLPIWDEPPYTLVDSVIEPWSFNLMVIEDGKVTMPDGSNVRKAIVDLMHKLQKKLLNTDEGDTQSIQNIINIYSVLLFNKTRNQDFEFHWKNFHVAKKILEDRVHQKKQHLRHLHLDRAMLQQEFRMESRNCSFTQTHKQILEDLWELSVSRYSEVRMAAQSKLYGVIQYFAYSYTVLTPKITEILKTDSVENHETFKGCLYVLLGPKNAPILARHDWEFIKEIWPLLVKSMPSEKPSIVNLISALTDTVHKYFPTIAIKLSIPEKTLSSARHFASVGPFPCDIKKFQTLIDGGEAYLMKKSLQRREAHDKTVTCLLENLENGNLHWRHKSMAISFLKDLVHFDVKYDEKVVRYFLKAAISDSLTVRKSAMKMLVFISIQNKPKFKKIEVDPYKLSGTKHNGKLIPGEREDNKWLQYNSNTAPKTNAQWEEIRYIHDNVTGYYAWPKKLMLYAPASQQISVCPVSRLDQMTATEKEIYNFFKSEDNVSQLIKYLSMEEKKGTDHFNNYRFLAFKGIFKIFQDEFLPTFVPHLQKLVQDKNESSQRCAAEIIGGIIRSSKHWQFEKIQKLWQTLIPILNTAITNILNETLTDWVLCFDVALEYRDPNMYHWLLEFLMDDPLKDSTSFVACSRLQILNTAINQQSWRNVEIFNRLLEYFKPHLTHPFQNIREKISAFLAVTYSKDVIFPLGNTTSGPKVEDFFKEVTPKLDQLYFHLTKQTSDTSDMETCDNLGLSSNVTDKEKEDLMRLFKIVAKFVMLTVVGRNFTARPEFHKLLPLVAVLQNYEIDEEVATLATNLIVVLGQTMTWKKYIPDSLEAIKKVVHCPLWSARAVLAEYLPVFLFYNMPTIHSNQEWVQKVQNLVLQLLEDPQPEVRLEAAKVVSGLLHCHFVSDPTDLLEIFKQKARTKIKKGRKQIGDDDVTTGRNLIRRHAGVLGLCSFINAHPYDVPEYLPSVFEALGPHLSDPQPIPAAIRKTMGDFKRTHHDNWELHKLKFTEEELLVLSDLSVPPSYCV